MTEHAPTIRGLKPIIVQDRHHGVARSDGTRPDNQGIETNAVAGTAHHVRLRVTEHAPTIRGLKRASSVVCSDKHLANVTEHAPTIRGLKHNNSHAIPSPCRRVTEHAPTIRGLKPNRVRHVKIVFWPW